MSSALGPLARPPRPVSALLLAHVTFGSLLTQMGAGFFGFGMIFIWTFGAFTNPTTELRLLGETAVAHGLVTQINETNAEVNGRDMLEVCYRYGVKGEELEACSYTTDEPPALGEEVEVDYAVGYPAAARLAGADASMMPFWVIFAVAIFPGIGLVMAIHGVVQGRRASRLLVEGEIGTGKLVEERPTNVRINRRTVIAMIFELRTQTGEIVRAEARTHEPERLRDQPEERLFYNPTEPERAVLLDALPGDPVGDGSGGLAPRSPAKSMAALVVPLVCFGGNLAVGLILLALSS